MRINGLGNYTSPNRTKSILIILLTLFGFIVGNELGGSVYYYLTSGFFQSSVLDFVQTDKEFIMRGLFSAIMGYFLWYIASKKLENRYSILVLAVIVFFIMKHIVFWGSGGSFSLDSIGAAFSITFRLQELVFLVTHFVLAIVQIKGSKL